MLTGLNISKEKVLLIIILVLLLRHSTVRIKFRSNKSQLTWVMTVDIHSQWHSLVISVWLWVSHYVYDYGRRCYYILVPVLPVVGRLVGFWCTLSLCLSLTMAIRQSLTSSFSFSAQAPVTSADLTIDLSFGPLWTMSIFKWRSWTPTLSEKQHHCQFTLWFFSLTAISVPNVGSFFIWM